MYRRIELINSFKRKDGTIEWYKQGLMGVCEDLVADAWDGLHMPRKRIRKDSGRFYFTELGWDMYGRAVVAACQKVGQEYRVKAVEEHDRNYDVYYKDEVQVVLIPRKRRE